MKKTFSYAIKGIGIVLFIWILTKIDIGELKRSLTSVSLVHLLLTLILFPVIYLIKSLRWHILSSSAGAKTTLDQSIRIYMIGMFLGIATPGKLGEAMKIPALISRGLTLKSATGITILDRLMDIAILGLLGIWAIGSLISVKLAGLVLVSVILLGLIAFVLRKLTLKLLPQIDTNSWARAIALTIINWAVYFLQLWILATGFGLSINPQIFVAIMTLVGIISILPIAPAGLGTRDAALLLFFGSLGISAEKTIAFSFTIFALTIIASSIGAYFWIKYPIKKINAQEPLQN
ncbi:MAG: lysylphosphatidylglycerol synthase transmembrane domain-containing protein [Candidatus Peribacteraceae bacterium]|jgi:uncharacterized membrane protein YbhN (UPF0104 family)|nr:lysylphosphatidylglycerol synthase transmembrane domain-containing protein [Candidatus Peribacteraceae bacterium]HCI03374.1 hypothetical protein [Candidatus Peribacteria bacterium]|tara:strand:- start:100 stop:972 length:873 start_codon:yes stop_codon:yes gene_type:complete